MQGLCLVIAAHGFVKKCEVIQGGSNIGVIITEGPRIDRQCSLEVGFGFAVAAHSSVYKSEMRQEYSYM